MARTVLVLALLCRPVPQQKPHAMVYPVLQRELNVSLGDGDWAVRAIDEMATGILGPVD